jgi:hypothetical protein
MRFSETEYQILKNKKNVFNDNDAPDEGKEKELDLKISHYIKDRGLYGFHDKSRGVNKAGHVDWVIALPNSRTLWIECKAKKGRLSEEQKNNMLLLKGFGHEVYEVRSFKGFLDIINKKAR